MSEPLNVWDYEALAVERLEAGAHGYYAGGAGDELTLRGNVGADRGGQVCCDRARYELPHDEPHRWRVPSGSWHVVRRQFTVERF